MDCKIKTEFLKKGVLHHGCMPESAEVSKIAGIYRFVSNKRSSSLKCIP